jgi:DNA-binding NarL/FixJ family response regulator
MIRVLLVDDQKLVRAGLQMILSAEPDITVVGEAADGATAAAACAEQRPDVVLMDIRMPGCNGIDATRDILRLPSPPRVLIFTTFDVDEYVYDALRAGASGFLLKDAPDEQLLAAIRTVNEGVSLRFAPARAAADSRLSTLTPRETDVLVAITAGRSNAEIGKQLQVSEATVKTHVTHLLTKLGLTSRTQAVVFGYESGLVEVGSGRTDG